MLPPCALIMGRAKSAGARCQVLRDNLHSIKKLNEIIYNICISTSKPAGPRMHLQDRFTLLVVNRNQGSVIRYKLGEVIMYISRNSSHIPTITVLGNLT